LPCDTTLSLHISAHARQASPDVASSLFVEPIDSRQTFKDSQVGLISQGKIFFLFGHKNVFRGSKFVALQGPWRVHHKQGFLRDTAKRVDRAHFNHSDKPVKLDRIFGKLSRPRRHAVVHTSVS